MRFIINSTPNPDLIPADRTRERKHVPRSEIADHGRSRLAYAHFEDDTEQKVYAYKTAKGWVPELRGEECGRMRRGIEQRVAAVLEAGDPEGALFREDSHTQAEVTEVYGIERGIRSIDYDHTQRGSFLVIHDEINSHGRTPFGKSSADERAREGVMRIATTLDGRDMKPLGPTQDPTSINIQPYPFESTPTDVLSRAIFIPGKGWTVQQLPFGEVGIGPWQTVLHYGGGGCITGMVGYQNNQGKMQVFEAQKHIERFCRDAQKLGFKEVTEELIRKMLENHLQSDRRWIPQVANKAGNRYYIRFSLFMDNAGPKLAGPQAIIQLIGTPIGAYKADFLKVGLLGPRPVSDRIAVNKASQHYPESIISFMSHPTQMAKSEPGKPYLHEGIYLNASGNAEEGVSANMGVVIRDPDIGTVRILSPDPAVNRCLPGIVMQSCFKIAKENEILMEYNPEINICQILRQNKGNVELFMTGTAMTVCEIDELYDHDGSLLYQRQPQPGETPERKVMSPTVGLLRREMDRILTGTQLNPGLQSLMEDATSA